MVDVVIALGLGGLLAHLLGGSIAGVRGGQPPREERSKRTPSPAARPSEARLTAAKQKPPRPPLVAPGAPGAPTAASPRKATQTVRKFK